MIIVFHGDVLEDSSSQLLKTWSSFVGGEKPSMVDRIAKLVADLLIERKCIIEEAWLRRDGHYDEIREIVESIVAHI